MRLRARIKLTTSRPFAFLIVGVRVAVFVATLLGGGAVRGQSPSRTDLRLSRTEPDSFVNQQRVIDEQLRRELDAEPAWSESVKSSFDWGGWYTFNLFRFDDGEESSRTFRRHDLRLWGRWVLDGGAHELYARGRVSFLDFNSGDSYDGNDDDVEGPNLERGYYRFDLARAIQSESGRVIDSNLIVTLGRDFAQFGDGLALAAPLDMVSLRGTMYDLEVLAIAGKTVGSTDDFDLSRTATRLHRNYFGVQTKYVGFERHEPYAFALWQRDQNSEHRYTLGQRFDYNSEYYAVGSVGELTPRWNYLVELVYEAGESYGDGRFIRKNTIDAWASRSRLEYLFPGEERARASIEYLFGSGDSGRLGSPTDSIGGESVDHVDHGFVSLGYADTGLAFAPRFSNLHMVRIGGSLYPWPEDATFRRLELGSDWYFFHKHHRDGAVSDPTANVASGWLGWEMDYFANWRVTADFAWTTRFGTFFPGDAFDDRSVRPFLLVGFTYSF